MPSKADLNKIESTSLYSLRYHSSRLEVWRWYWRLWRKQLWFIHVITTALILFFVVELFSLDTTFKNVLTLSLMLPIFVILSAAWPQLRFKSQERILKIGPDGYATHIGKISGARLWSEVHSVRESGNTITIQVKNGSALIVPRRAFTSTNEWKEFLADVQHWHLAT